MGWEEDMNNAATQASEDLNSLLDEDAESINRVAVWYAKWYMRAGHKRLGRILADIGRHPIIPMPDTSS